MDEELTLKLAEAETHQMLERLANRAEIENENKRMAQQIQEKLNKEIEADVLKKKKEALKRVISKNSKLNNDKRKFMDFLKTRGYNRKQLGPMKLSNLLSLYEKEKKILKEEKEKERFEKERLLKAALDKGATVVDTRSGEERRSKNREDIHPSQGVPVSVSQTSTKRKKSVPRTGPAIRNQNPLLPLSKKVCKCHQK